jgi:hypothetical protein
MSNQLQRKRDNDRLFSNATVEKIVRQSGWDETRKANRAKLAEKIKKDGYLILENGLDFMEQFEGLIIYFENKKNGIKDDDINFDFEHATHLIDAERINLDYSVRIKKPLMLIGSAYRDHFVLLMSDDKNVYGAFDSFICKIADSGIEAIEAIILDKDFETID